MTQAAISQGASGELLLTGVLDYSTGTALRKQGQALVKASQGTALVLDCAGVVKSSSVGLSLLLCLQRDAIASGKTLAFRGLPRDMQQIAEVCQLTGILSAA
ncbi:MULTISPECIES: STAS domain-containing protein [Pseudomonas]|uniref:STAS domain-containing protein n=1 Tax=Pseudomonas eucalypticola TaxID=2599595 RepID=A0A7D5H2Q2_9PSED|nr:MULTISPECIES: STAS domain-containing protein [Pseudomonas]QKZ06707.1 STAS domain-containing protein [Pseudomonas eucalypticola]